jgi:hypothetical protein
LAHRYYQVAWLCPSLCAWALLSLVIGHELSLCQEEKKRVVETLTVVVFNVLV